MPARALLAISFAALLWNCALPVSRNLEERQPPAKSAFDPALVRRGAELAAVGDCAGCHTRQGSAPFAGGVPLRTPFGTIYGTNITPEPETGLGRWTQADFDRAMREGLAPDGRHLYPAFPYPYFRHLTDEDLRALYAFVMTRDPVRSPPPRNDLAFPFNIRPLVAGWNQLYLGKDDVPRDAAKGTEWNRGAYLVHGLGHCGACHSPRTALGAEKRGEALSGGEAEDWYAPALNRASPSPLAWTKEDLVTYLRTGIAEHHAIAAGPMQTVIAQLSGASEADLAAIAGYIVSMMDGAGARPLGAMPEAPQDERTAMGRRIYEETCASCHDSGRTLSSGGALQLPLAVALHDPDPRSLIHLILEGVQPPPGEPGRSMPGYAGALTKEQVVALLAYLRTLAAEAPPWKDLDPAVERAGAGR
ncbi:MAG: c-type cytochrome [Betaproteobacteria bacterium]|nr:c-type cytochrome [Betaproteobacteria bacterium]